ncbi:hypothetical protein ACWDO0_21995 [Nocardia rhamnosiphila]
MSSPRIEKSRYAGAGIPWYWEVALAADDSTIATIRAYALQTGAAQLPDGVHPLHPTNYLLAGEWTPADEDGVLIDFPFPIRIGWPELAF